MTHSRVSGTLVNPRSIARVDWVAPGTPVWSARDGQSLGCSCRRPAGQSQRLKGYEIESTWMTAAANIVLLSIVLGLVKLGDCSPAFQGSHIYSSGIADRRCTCHSPF